MVELASPNFIHGIVRCVRESLSWEGCWVWDGICSDEPILCSMYG